MLKVESMWLKSGKSFFIIHSCNNSIWNKYHFLLSHVVVSGDSTECDGILSAGGFTLKLHLECLGLDKLINKQSCRENVPFEWNYLTTQWCNNVCNRNWTRFKDKCYMIFIFFSAGNNEISFQKAILGVDIPRDLLLQVTFSQRETWNHARVLTCGVLVQLASLL